jgi:hypothetical protein
MRIATNRKPNYELLCLTQIIIICLFQLHFIFRHKNPLNGSSEEKHAKKSKDRIEEPFKDKRPHLYTLVVNPDNTYQVLVDHKVRL